MRNKPYLLIVEYSDAPQGEVRQWFDTVQNARDMGESFRDNPKSEGYYIEHVTYPVRSMWDVEAGATTVALAHFDGESVNVGVYEATYTLTCGHSSACDVEAGSQAEAQTIMDSISKAMREDGVTSECSDCSGYWGKHINSALDSLYGAK